MTRREGVVREELPRLAADLPQRFGGLHRSRMTAELLEPMSDIAAMRGGCLSPFIMPVAAQAVARRQGRRPDTVAASAEGARAA